MCLSARHQSWLQRVSSSINNSSRSGGSEPKWDGPSQPPGGKRKMDEVVRIPKQCLLGKGMLNFKPSLEPSQCPKLFLCSVRLIPWSVRKREPAGTFGNAIGEGIWTYQKEVRDLKPWHQRYLKGSFQETFLPMGSDLLSCAGGKRI